MISDYLGETAFRKGLNIYLNRFKYSNAVTEGENPLFQSPIFLKSSFFLLLVLIFSFRFMASTF